MIIYYTIKLVEKISRDQFLDAHIRLLTGRHVFHTIVIVVFKTAEWIFPDYKYRLKSLNLLPLI